MALDVDQLKALLQKLDDLLSCPVRLCVIGSGATILLGQPARQTDDLDIWESASQIPMTEFARAVKAAGMEFDPKTEFPGAPYVQIIRPGIVQVPGWDPAKRQWLGEDEKAVWQGRNLTVTAPPPRVIVASKLIRGNDRDLEDCLWLVAAHALEATAITKAIKALPAVARASATDNSEVLALMRPK